MERIRTHIVIRKLLFTSESDIFAVKSVVFLCVLPISVLNIYLFVTLARSTMLNEIDV